MVRAANDSAVAAQAKGETDAGGSVAQEALQGAERLAQGLVQGVVAAERPKPVGHEQLVLEQEEESERESLWFSALVAASVFANVQAVALETDYGCAGFGCPIQDRLPWYVCDNVFTLLFLADVGVTMVRTGPVKYLRGEPRQRALGFDALNCADVLVVALRAVDVWILSPAGVETGLRLVSLLRIVHMTRFVRALRLAPAFRELWLVVAGMAETAKAVAWVVVLLALLLWVFATLVTIAVSDGGAAAFDFGQAAWSREEYWGDVPRSMYSLFQVFTGDRWSDSLAWPLIRPYPWLVALFVAFRAAAILALVNTVVGVIVEATLSGARANEEVRAKEQKRQDAVVTESLRGIFREADADASGELDREELAAMVRTPAVRDRMRLLGIPVRELQLLHGLLDATGEGNVDTDAFFRGCARLRGPAMAVDLHRMSVDLDRHGAMADVLVDGVEEANDALAELLDLVTGVDVEVVKGDADEKDPVLQARRKRERRSAAGILRSSNWVDQQPPRYLLDEEREIRHASKNSVRRPSLLRNTLRAGAPVEEHPVLGRPLAYAPPATVPAPPPLPGRASSKTSRSSGRGLHPGQKTFQWPS